MSAVMLTKDTFRDALTRASDALPGQKLSWLTAVRDRALTRFLDLGFPTPKDEAWKYTDLRPLLSQSFAPSAVSLPMDVAAVSQHFFGNGQAHRLTFVDGRFRPELSDLTTLPSGVQLLSWAQTLQNNVELAQQIVDADIASINALSALNLALLTDAAIIKVADGVKVERPIHVLFVASGAAGVSSSVRLHVALGRDAEASVVESFVAMGDGVSWTNTDATLILGEDAKLDYCLLQEESEKSFHTGRASVLLAANSVFSAHDIALGGRLARRELTVDFQGSGSAAQLSGLTLVGGRQHADQQLRLDHRAPGTNSQTHYKDVLADRSRAVFNGQIFVHVDAQQTDARLTNNNLLLSNDAEIDTKPQLEIYADDVKCSHGATVGQLDDTSLHYLRSRGIDEETAKSLLVYAFGSEIIGHIRHTDIRAHLQQAVLAKLPNSERLQGVV